MTKQFVVLLFTNGGTRIAADYGDFAWGSALYTVIGYAPTYAKAQAMARDAERSREAS